MPAPEQSRKIFLLFTIVLVVLVVVGLIWAVASDSRNSGGGSLTGGFSTENSPTQGTGDTVVFVFGDFQCPACRSAEPAYRNAVEKYGDRVTFIWKDFPLQGTHPLALSGANAARCAEEQGKFWAYHDRLYDDQPTWSGQSDPTEQFASYATALGLDADAFRACYDERRYQSVILRDVREGQDAGIGGTPTFFIGDRVMTRVLSDREWDEAIQAALTPDS